MVEEEYKFKFDNYSRHLGIRGEYEWYKWKVFMDEPPDVLDKVSSIVYKLHETFANPIRIVNDRKSRFALSSVSWSGFWIHITVYLKDEREILTKYWLDLNRPQPAGEPTMYDIETQLAKEALQKNSVLIINDGKDIDIYSRGHQSLLAFMLAFGNMEYNVRIENSKETIYSTWTNYDIVIWSCGDDYSPINDSKNIQKLSDYVAQGGRLLLESGNIAGWIGETVRTIVDREFQEKVLHATTDWVYHDVGDLTLKNTHPIATTPNKLPETIGFTPNNPGDHSGDANAVRILPDAIGLYIWSHVAYGGKLVGESIASISYGLIAYESESENGGRIVSYAFNIDDIDSPDIRQKLIQNSANWLTRTSKYSMH